MLMWRLYASCHGILPDTVGQPQALVFIGLKKGSGQEYLSREPLTEQQALALLHASAGRLFSIIYYINSFL